MASPLGSFLWGTRGLWLWYGAAKALTFTNVARAYLAYSLARGAIRRARRAFRRG